MAEGLFNTTDFKQAVPVRPDLDVATQRITDVYSRASSQQIDEGMAWYDTAHDLAIDMQLAYPSRLESIAHAAGLLAALSPNEGWENNVTNAWMFLQRDTSRSLPRSIDDARLICSGFDPELVLFRGGVNFKVQSFFQNIADPTDPGPVTIDRHAKGIIYDNPLVVKKKAHATRADYDHYSEAYRRAAKEADIIPSQMQAVTWLVWRNVAQKDSDASKAQLTLL